MLNKKVLELLNEPRMRAKIVLASKKEITDSTVKRWIKNNHSTLTEYWVLTLIKEELNLSEDEILDKTKVGV